MLLMSINPATTNFRNSWYHKLQKFLLPQTSEIPATTNFRNSCYHKLAYFKVPKMLLEFVLFKNNIIKRAYISNLHSYP